jgi:GNAT superfamily N-acetyltransferase
VAAACGKPLTNVTTVTTVMTEKISQTISKTMVKIRPIHDAVSPRDQLAVAAVLKLYQKAFSGYPQYVVRTGELLRFAGQLDYEPILFVAEDRNEHVVGFALIFYFARARYAYLDYILVDPKHTNCGCGTVLYEATRQHLLTLTCRGVFMDVPTDDEAVLSDDAELQLNRRRLTFYQRFGACPITNTLYERSWNKANQGFFTYLIFDGLKADRILPRSDAQMMVSKILFAKAAMKADNPRVKLILESIQDDPIRLRAPIADIRGAHRDVAKRYIHVQHGPVSQLAQLECDLSNKPPIL